MSEGWLIVEKNDKKNNPARGLENNPSKDGHIFSNKHSYFPSSCSTCPYGTKKGNLFALAAKRKGDCYACERIEGSILKRKRVKKLEAFSVATNKPAFRIEQEKLLAFFESKEEVVRHHNDLYTKHLFFGIDQYDKIKGHCYNALELKATQDIYKIIPQLKNGRYLPVDMSRKNYKKKMREGVLHFTAYDVNYRGCSFVLKCYVKKNGTYLCEYPYSLKQKE